MSLGEWSREPERLIERIYPSRQRKPGGLTGAGVRLAAAGLAVTTLYMGLFGQFGEIETRAGHLMVIIPLALLLYPACNKSDPRNPSAIDFTMALLAALSFGWAIYSASTWQWRVAYVDPVKTIDFVMGCIAIFVVLEATRRTVGVTIVALTSIFIVYALTGPYWPGMFSHTGTSVLRIVEQSYIFSEGLFNVITGIAATFLFSFLAFGVMLQAVGGDKYFMDLAMAAAGRKSGGAAKVSIISSGLMGMLSGSTVSNVVTTGSVTIPLMKRTGFKSHEAAAIEATSSVGGALTPPLMGAGIFLMAQFTGVPLITIMLYSIAPAIIYFSSIYAYVHVKASKRNIAPMEASSLPKFKEVFLQCWHLFIPLLTLIVLLAVQYTPFFASSISVIFLFICSMLRSNTRLSFQQFLIALEGTTRALIMISTLSAAAALIFGVITITGLVVKVSSIILSLSMGISFIAIALVALMSYVVGMGLPVTASYIIIATLGAPALGDMGLSLLTAHLIIYWLSQDSTITPPICMTAIVAAGIAKAEPMRTGWHSVMLGKALYIVPFIFAYGGLLSDNIFSVFSSFILSIFAVVLIPVVMEGYLYRTLSKGERLLFLLMSALAVYATTLELVLSLILGSLIICMTIIYTLLLIKSARDRGAELARH